MHRVGLLAFHLALINHPQDPLVVWTFASILYYGKWCKAVEFARENAKIGVHFSPEILEMSASKSDESLSKDVSHLAFLVISSIDALTGTDALLEMMGRYACSPHVGPVSAKFSYSFLNKPLCYEPYQYRELEMHQIILHSAYTLFLFPSSFCLQNV